MNVFTTVVKNFTVVNDLPQFVLVQLQLQPERHAALSATTPLSQLLPSGGVAGFDVTFQSSTPCDVHEPVRFIINGQHKQQFAVHARATPITLQLSRRDVQFRFAQDSVEQTVSDFLMLHNPGTSPAAFTWRQLVSSSEAVMASASAQALLGKAMHSRAPPTPSARGGGRPPTGAAPPSSTLQRAADTAPAAAATIGTPEGVMHAFEILPMSGEVPAGGHLRVALTYRPRFGALLRAAFALDVVGGEASDQPALLLSGEPQDARLVCSEARCLDFGKVGAGNAKEMVISIRNEGPTAGVFFTGVAAHMPPGIMVLPSCARIEPGDSCDVTVQLQANVVSNLNPAQHA
ncbi:MAG: hypothetical protein EOO41_02805, partial [Methanobacteriota archaeon]